MLRLKTTTINLVHGEDQKLSGRKKRAFSIRYKIVVLVTLFFVLQTLFLIWVSAATVSKQFLALEDQEAERAVMQAANTLITFSSVPAGTNSMMMWGAPSSST